MMRFFKEKKKKKKNFLTVETAVADRIDLDLEEKMLTEKGAE